MERSGGGNFSYGGDADGGVGEIMRRGESVRTEVESKSCNTVGRGP